MKFMWEDIIISMNWGGDTMVFIMFYPQSGCIRWITTDRWWFIDVTHNNMPNFMKNKVIEIWGFALWKTKCRHTGQWEPTCGNLHDKDISFGSEWTLKVILTHVMEWITFRIISAYDPNSKRKQENWEKTLASPYPWFSVFLFIWQFISDNGLV